MSSRAVPSFVIVLFSLLMLPGVASAASGRCGSCGIVEKVEKIVYDKDKGVGGAVLGTIVGGLIGNQFGSGSGRTAMTVAGAAGGGLIGHKVDKNHSANGEPGLRLSIRMDKGGYKTLEIAGEQRIYKGDRVKVFRDHVELVD
ncbi:MAG TPA: glycine zipper 2TM domain-containing protein [Xanthomonadales bacterium]|nr:glycine zipper 2TM domain-containing protein [Xanthomonadales bacterium]